MTSAGLRRSLAAAALALAALSGCAHRAARPDDMPSKEAVEDIRAMMYAEQDLEVLLPKMDLPGEGNRALELLSAGKAKEAAQVMTPAVREAGGAAAVMADVAIKQRLGDAKGAEAELRGLIREPKAEALWRLWAAHALRRMGASLDEDLADALLGVVVETPGDARAEAMAVYPDLNMRYIPDEGPILAYDPEDGRLNDVLAAIGPAAQAVYLKAPLVAEGARPALGKDEFRITFLTPRGPRRVRGNIDTIGQGEYREVIQGFANVLGTLVKLHQEAQAARR